MKKICYEKSSLWSLKIWGQTNINKNQPHLFIVNKRKSGYVNIIQLTTQIPHVVTAKKIFKYEDMNVNLSGLCAHL